MAFLLTLSRAQTQ